MISWRGVAKKRRKQGAPAAAIKSRSGVARTQHSLPEDNGFEGLYGMDRQPIQGISTARV
jgi:hypothetical protein